MTVRTQAGKTREAKTELVAEIAASVAERLAEKGELARAFVERYFEGAAYEDLREVERQDLEGSVLGVYGFARQRRPGAPKIRVYNPTHEEHGWESTHTIVEVVNDDMSFLVDSTVAALNGQDLTVHLLIHPVMKVERDGDGRLLSVGEGAAESIMHVQVSRQPSEAKLRAIQGELEGVLGDVRQAVEDWKPMSDQLHRIIEELDRRPPPLPEEVVAEGKAFLSWLHDEHFTFLGFREYRLERHGDKDYQPIVEGSGLGILRRVSEESARRHSLPLPRSHSRVARRRELLIITTASARSRVHRPVYMDYIGVRSFDEAGEVTGERRFLGLFTSAAYNRNPSDIPLLRRKVRRVIERSGYRPGGHDTKVLKNILDTYPRNELFQISEEELLQIAQGIRHLDERQRIRLFVRRDSYARFFSCLVYAPRDRYNTQLRERFEKILMEAFGGQGVEFTTRISDSPMARVHFIIRTSAKPPPYDLGEVEAKLAAASRLWTDDLRDALVERWGEGRGIALFHRYRDAFQPGYAARYPARTGAVDVGRCEQAIEADDVAMALYRRPESPEDRVHFRLYQLGRPARLSDVLPMLEHMGTKVLGEAAFLISPEDGESVWVHDFELQLEGGADLQLGDIRRPFEEAFWRVWHGWLENDGFNALVLGARLSWREVTVVRAYFRYLRQIAPVFSQRYTQAALRRNPEVVRFLLDLHAARFDPEGANEEEAAAIRWQIRAALDRVESLDDDRILRRLLDLVENTLRTNFYQPAAGGGPKRYLSFKLDSRKVDQLPKPRPRVEIFVYSPRVEAVHLRGGKVARGGLRWSDRPEDFRTEVLGLMKAQMVKNAVIVPVGSKGGFVVKRPPAATGDPARDREAQRAEGIDCYRTMQRGLLDLTDNLRGDEVVPPEGVVRADGDDSYLVVAADKGTATFSDLANELSEEYGFWLGDAYASGGSAGYDHKKMGITARGAWESVRRHFREMEVDDRGMGIDTQRQAFTAVGVGDMAGDVFGNGMLLSEHLRLVGAFNHLHLFLDPDPDPATSFAERKRLFDAALGWDGYDRSLISEGGGVFERSAKSIPLSPEIRELLQLDGDAATPAEVIRALLRAPVDLLWFGGIGTFVKARGESDADAGDRANDALRIDATELRAKVVAEGANLGLTQRGRIEYALGGGRINTDFIDNSAGVDCSDHEVNIKILLGGVVADGDLTRKQRDELLREMTDEVAALVLRDNYQQTLAITLAESRAVQELDRHAQLIRTLERAKKLDRALELLPDDEQIAERQAAGKGLTRPEIAVLLAYAKIVLYRQLLRSELPDEEPLLADLLRYFPSPLVERYRDEIGRHPLRREIIATAVTNSMVNRVGPTFVQRLHADTGAAPDDVARAYAVTRDAFDLRPLWREIEALDDVVPAAVQTSMFLMAMELIERGSRWFLTRLERPLEIGAATEAYARGIRELAGGFERILSPEGARELEERSRGLVERGVPATLAKSVARLPALASGCDVVGIARAANVPALDVGRLYFAVGERFGIEWLRAEAERLHGENHWQKLAIQAMIEELYNHQSDLTAAILAAGPPPGEAVDRVIDGWIEERRPAAERSQELLAELRTAGTLDHAMLAVANRRFRALLDR